ncbi:uncharacterized protein LOC126844982 isoform X2 [Adelges cooleyi]|uniref:uncharacterized protein LOC126844982 isoform X2 n=1 Tax=Adelges cooleyi TaxID=133065 RepID=UPI0021808547|nr:uncharacterized protein LOC126844982 isoform X2 [Adelges cooleyi]
MLKLDRLDLNKKELVMLESYNSPFDFTVKRNTIKFDAFMENIKCSLENREVLNVKDLQLQEYIIAKSLGCGTRVTVYRVQILHINSNFKELEVCFIDKSKKKKLQASDWMFYRMDFSDSTYPVHAPLKCVLFDLWLPYPRMGKYEEISVHFRIGEVYLCETTEIMNSEIHIVSMFTMVNEKDLVTSILECGIGQRLSAIMNGSTTEYPYDCELLIGQTFLAYISPFKEKTVYVQPEPYSLDVLEQEIEEYANNAPVRLSSDQIYCIANHDNKWFRALIKHRSCNSVTVLLIDYGNEVKVSFKEIKPISDYLLKCCRKCVKCEADTVFVPKKKTIYIVKAISQKNDGSLLIHVGSYNGNQYFPQPVLRHFEKVLVSHIEEDTVFMQRVDRFNEIEQLVCRIPNSIMPGLAILDIGRVCVTNDTRVVLEQFSSDQVILRDIDYGVTLEHQQNSDLKPTKMSMYPGCAIQAKINSIMPYVGQYCTVWFMVGHDGKANAFFPDQGPLSSKFDDQTLQGPKIWQDDCEAIVAHCYGLDCWLVTEPYFNIRSTLADALNKMIDDAMPAERQDGCLCGAYDDEDGVWRRALIRYRDRALCVDTGKVFDVTKQPRKLTSSLESTPNCATRCRWNASSTVDIQSLKLSDVVTCQFVDRKRVPVEVALHPRSVNGDGEIVFASSGNDQLGKSSPPDKLIKMKNSSRNSFLPPAKPTKPTVNKTWTVTMVSFDSLDSFYIQNNEDEVLLRWFSDFIEALPKSDQIDDTWLLEEVVGVFNEETGLWSRALCSRMMCSRMEPEEVAVDFIDYYNFTILSIDEQLVRGFKRLPDRLKKIPPLIHECCLKDLQSEDSNELSSLNLIKLFVKYLNTEVLTVKFFSKTKPYSVSLSCGGKDLLTMVNNLLWYGLLPDRDDLIEKANRAELNKRSLDGSPLVSVGPIYSYQLFYLETAYEVEMKRSIEEEISKTIATDPVQVQNPTVGQLVIVKSPLALDEKWYRARVLNRFKDRPGEYRCFLVDYGTYEVCSDIFKPNDRLKTMAQAIVLCSLKLQKPIQEPYVDSVNLGFIDEMSTNVNPPNTITVHLLTESFAQVALVDLRVNNLSMSTIISPLLVTVHNPSSLHMFVAQLITPDRVKVANVLNNLKKFVPATKAKIDQIYVAQVSGGQYKRVKYVDDRSPSDGGGHNVQLVDEAMEFVIVNKLYAVPKNIVNAKTMFVDCSLNLNEHKCSLTKFQNLCDNGRTKFTMVIVKHDYDLGHQVDLYFNKNDIKSLILADS